MTSFARLGIRSTRATSMPALPSQTPCPSLFNTISCRSQRLSAIFLGLSLFEQARQFVTAAVRTRGVGSPLQDYGPVERTRELSKNLKDLPCDWDAFEYPMLC